MGRDENRSVHEFYHLKALNSFEQMNTSVVEKRRIFIGRLGY